jgi:hypothetical protein
MQISKHKYYFHDIWFVLYQVYDFGIVISRDHYLSEIVYIKKYYNQIYDKYIIV